MNCVDKNLHLWRVGVAAIVKIGLIPSSAATTTKPSPIALAWDPPDNFIQAEQSATWFSER